MVEDDDGAGDVSAPWSLTRLEELGVTLRSVNVLGHGELRRPIDVKQLALLVRNADYKPRGFGALVLRFQEPRASMLVYKSGKFIVVGARTPDDADVTVQKLLGVLQKVGFSNELVRYTLANVINSADVKFRIRLEGLQADHMNHCTYEPELFPGLIYRFRDPKVTLLVFVSGKVMLTGAKTQEDAERVLCKMFPVFLQYRLRSESSDEDDSSSSSETDDDPTALDADDEISDEDDGSVLI